MNLELTATRKKHPHGKLRILTLSNCRRVSDKLRDIYFAKYDRSEMEEIETGTSGGINALFCLIL